MAKLKWDETGKRLYETGTENGALYVIGDNGAYSQGVAWNGLIGVSQTSEGGEETPIFANNSKYLSMLSKEELKGTITAYTHPDEWQECDGSKELTPGVYVGQQNRKGFGLIYETIVGNDTKGNDYGRKLHIIFNAKAKPSERDYKTINNDPEANEFSWEYSTTPVDMPNGLQRSARIVIDSTVVTQEKYNKVIDYVFGSESAAPTFPTPAKIIELLAD